MAQPVLTRKTATMINSAIEENHPEHLRHAPRVLLIATDPRIASQFRNALPGCDVRTLADESHLERVVAEQATEVVVGEWSDALIQRLRASRGTVRFVHFATVLSPAILEAIADGNELFHVDRIEALQTTVLGLARRPRRASRQHVAGVRVTFTGAPGPFSVIDVSLEGFSFEVLGAGDLSGLQPGARLDDLLLRRGDEIVIEGISAQVRRIEVRDGKYRIGCEIRPAERDRGDGPLRLIHDRAQCAGLLLSALRSSALVLTDPTSGEQIRCTDGLVDPLKGDVTLPGVEHPFQIFDVTEGQFELSGGGYRFQAAVCSDGPLRIKVPAVIEETRRRSTMRWRPLGTPLSISLSSSLSGAPLKQTVHDLSATGLSFYADRHDLLPLGLRFARIELRLGDCVLMLSGQVRHLLRTAGGLRCGIRFDEMNQASRCLLQDALVRGNVPGLENGRTVDFDELWQFFRDTKFLNGAKEALLAPMMEEVRHAHGALAAAPTAIASSVAVRQHLRVVAHSAGLRAYRSTWMFHHLAALEGKRCGPLVSLGAVEWLMQSAEHEHFRLWFYVDAPFPDRMFGGYARKVPDPDQSCLRYFSHFQLPVTRRFGAAGDLEVSEASDAELAVVERYFIANERPLIVRAEDLLASGLRLEEVERSYREAGVARRRRVLLARRSGVPVGFALAEISSPGLNLSEALSSFRLFVLPAGEARKQSVRRALLDAALATYAESGRPMARCLIDPPEAPDFVALGIELDAGQSACWTSHRSQLRPFADHMRRLFASKLRRGGTTTVTVLPAVANG